MGNVGVFPLQLCLERWPLQGATILNCGRELGAGSTILHRKAGASRVLYNSNHATRLERVGCGTILITVRGLFGGAGLRRGQ